MKTVYAQHPNGEWCEVYRGSDEEAIQAVLSRFVLDFGLRCKVE
jgi:hypothetical protein